MGHLARHTTHGLKSVLIGGDPAAYGGEVSLGLHTHGLIAVLSGGAAAVYCRLVSLGLYIRCQIIMSCFLDSGKAK